MTVEERLQFIIIVIIPIQFIVSVLTRVSVFTGGHPSHPHRPEDLHRHIPLEQLDALHQQTHRRTAEPIDSEVPVGTKMRSSESANAQLKAHGSRCSIPLPPDSVRRRECLRRFSENALFVTPLTSQKLFNCITTCKSVKPNQGVRVCIAEICVRS